jgi:16S rRNA (guanine966-N2)-methyltransferase
MTRIIGGSARGRRLRTPPGDATRPTADRVREALFSALEAQLGTLSGVRFLDLYAGSGAVGLEAASRGAAAVTAVESDRRTARLVGDNARALAFDVDVRAQPVTAVLSTSPAAPYDVVFLDPPYPVPGEEVGRVLTLAITQGWLTPGGAVVVERSARSVEPRWPEGLEVLREKRYGETVLWYLRRHPAGAEHVADADRGMGDSGSPAVR